MGRREYPSDLAPKFLVRVPEGMREAIASRAKANMRSMNSEIVLILAHALGFSQGTTVAGESLQAKPATVPNATALQGGASTHAS
jgi:hypothetical protein